MTLHDSACASTAIETQAFSQSTFSKPSLRESSNREGAMRSNGSNGRSVVRQNRQNNSVRDAKNENQDWLAAQLSRRSVQEVVDSTGMNEKSVQNIRRKKSKISFDNLVDLCRDDPQFAAAFAAYIGLIRPGEAEFAGALTQAFNAYQRKQGRE